MDRDLISRQEVRDLCKQATDAQQQFSRAGQAEVDAICEAMARAGYKAARQLAELAVADTGMGKVEDKITKNEFASRDLWEVYRDFKTVGPIEIDRRGKHTVIAEPMGLVAAIIPTTNPTSTAIYKSIVSVKSRNAVVASPHPNAGECTLEAMRIMAQAAEQAGAPEGLIGCVAHPSIRAARELMEHPLVHIILATGGKAIVRAAHSTGKPAIGVGPGNVPAFIERSAHIDKAVHDIVIGKSFDWGVICSSEQAMIVDRSIEKRVLAAIKHEPVYWVKGDQRTMLENFMVADDGALNTTVVGQAPVKIAAAAGFVVPETTQVLLVEQEGVGKEFKLSREKLSPVLAYYTVGSSDEGISLAEKVVNYGGVGHTSVIHSNDEHVVQEFASRIRTFRVLVNTPAPHGSVGYSTNLDPGMTLGCGTWGGAITGDNITPLHLINRKHLAWETTAVTGYSGLDKDFASRRGNYSKYDDVSLPTGSAHQTRTNDEPDGDQIEQLARDFAARMDQQ